MNAVAPTQARTQVPAYLTQGFQPDLNNDLAGGLTGGFSVISYKGKVWRIKTKGVEDMMLDPTNNLPTQYLDVVILQANKDLSKIFYKDGYKEGDNSAPDCFSGNGKTPDPSSRSKQSAQCATCPQNVWGSRITDAGKKARACNDARRMAVVLLNEVHPDWNPADGYGPLLLRVPGASLTGLQDFAAKLNGYNLPYWGAHARIVFDVNSAFPKLDFAAVRFLSEGEFANVMEMKADTNAIEAILQAAENADADPEPQGTAPAQQATQQAQAAPQPAPAPQQQAQAAPAAAPAPAPNPTRGRRGAQAQAAAVSPPAAPAPLQAAPAPLTAPAPAAAIPVAAAPEELNELLGGLLN